MLSLLNQLKQDMNIYLLFVEWNKLDSYVNTKTDIKKSTRIVVMFLCAESNALYIYIIHNVHVTCSL